jgi:hypothetical protein
MQCPQRVSIRFGSSEAYGDFGFETLHGRVHGCSFEGDWWIRAMPMFGSAPSQGSLDGAVELDGKFMMSGQIEGQRMLLVIGKDKQPVKAVALNFTAGEANDVGDIDLAAVCPK